MNAERLHQILIEVKSEYEKKGILGKLQAVRGSLQNQVNQPQQPAYQQNLLAALKELDNTLSTSALNDFSPSWNQIMTTIGGDKLLGKALREKIKAIFATNQITPYSALQELTTIESQLTKFEESVDNLLSGFNYLNIGTEELKPGECELSYTIPRNYVHNKLHLLNKELTDLSFILNSISEAVTGKKQEFDVKTISTTDYTYYISLAVLVAKPLSQAIDKIIDVYKRILDIKKLRNELSQAGIPDVHTTGIEEYANTMMTTEIEKVVTTIMNEHQHKDNGRENELSNAVRIALNKIANRIDNGFSLEIRVKELPKSSETESKEETAVREMINIIKSNSKVMEFIKGDGQPILKLQEKDLE